MPRSQGGSRSGREADRLRRLRDALGFSQREMAAELKVAHGAVGLWESGARTIPGPVLKLMELFEEELGLHDGAPVTKPLTKLRTSFLSRGFKLSRTAAGATARAAAAALEKMFVSEERSSAVTATTQAAIARQIVDTLGEMKGFAMKVGQMASYLDFALPEPARDVLADLQRSTQPMAPRVVAETFLEDLGQSPRKLFTEWSPQPFAAASIGQVHRARLKTGEDVAVKVQYPGVVDAIRADLKNAALIDRASCLIFRAQEPGVLLAELGDHFLEECDYRLEAANQDEFRRLWAGRGGIAIPRVYTQLSTRRILVTELVEGEDFQTFVAHAAQEERNRTGELLWDFAFESIFRHNVFNGDPHPGNYLFRPRGVTFIDFGCVKRFEGPQIGRWRAFIRATLERDIPRANRLWIEMGLAPDPARYDFDYHQRMIRTLYEPWLLDRPFRFTPEYLARMWNATGFENRNRARMNVPKEWVFAHRLESGLYALLTKLGATANWRAKILDILYAPGEPRPQPFSEHELALLQTAVV
jgi:predicted unusual protein kinase regulating ubiquinone biosynthesis (AarF/ABC1/UbiB family)